MYCVLKVNQGHTCTVDINYPNAPYFSAIIKIIFITRSPVSVNTTKITKSNIGKTRWVIGSDIKRLITEITSGIEWKLVNRNAIILTTQMLLPFTERNNPSHVQYF